MKNKIHIIDEFCSLDQRGIGYLLSVSKSFDVNVNNHAEAIKIRAETEQLAIGLTVIYLFSLLEDFCAHEKIKAILAEKNDLLDEYLAYRHIRHSFAHSYKGKRANQHRKEFEDLYGKGALTNLIEWDQNEDTITLTPSFYSHLKNFLGKKIIGHLVNSDEFHAAQ